jgi:hypothetical protein
MSERIRAGSRFKLLLCSVLIDTRCFRIPLKCLRVPQVEDHCHRGILSTYYKFTLSAVTHKLNISGHILMWTFVLVFVCLPKISPLPSVKREKKQRRIEKIKEKWKEERKKERDRKKDDGLVFLFVAT